MNTFLLRTLLSKKINFIYSHCYKTGIKVLLTGVHLYILKVVCNSTDTGNNAHYSLVVLW